MNFQTRWKLIECPRDAWQGLKGLIPPDIQARLLAGLDQRWIQTHRCSLVRFAQGRAADGGLGRSVKELDPPDDVEIIGIVVQRKGARSGPSDTHAVPHSRLSVFDLRNILAQESEPIPLKTRSTNWKKIQKKAGDAALDVVVYISMAFGNPYGVCGM